MTDEGWLGPAQDVRSLLASGPFTLEAGETETLTIAWILARGETLADALDELRAKTSHVRTTADL